MCTLCAEKLKTTNSILQHVGSIHRKSDELLREWKENGGHFNLEPVALPDLGADGQLGVDIGQYVDHKQEMAEEPMEFDIIDYVEGNNVFEEFELD